MCLFAYSTAIFSHLYYYPPIYRLQLPVVSFSQIITCRLNLPHSSLLMVLSSPNTKPHTCQTIALTQNVLSSSNLQKLHVAGLYCLLLTSALNNLSKRYSLSRSATNLTIFPVVYFGEHSRMSCFTWLCPGKCFHH